MQRYKEAKQKRFTSKHVWCMIKVTLKLDGLWSSQGAEIVKTWSLKGLPKKIHHREKRKTSSQKLGRHASLRVRSVWKKLGPGKLQVKEVWAQNIFIDFLAELVNSFLLKFVWADHPSPPPLTHTPDQFQEILPRPKMFSLIFSLNWIVKKKITDLPPHPPSTNFRNPTQPKNEI